MIKKTLVISLVIIFVLPQVVSAAWWNPFSWNIFKRENKTKILEERLQELEKKLEEKETTLNQNNLSNSTTSTTTKSVKKENEIQKSPSIITSKNESKPVTTQPIKVVDTELLYLELINKFKDLNNQIRTERNGVSKSSSLVSERSYWDVMNTLLNRGEADLGYLSQVQYTSPRPSGIESIYLEKYNKLYQEYKNEINEYNSARQNDIKNSAREAVVGFINQYKYRLDEPVLHVQAAELLYLFDQAFNTNYNKDFESKKTQQETLEFANRFLIDQE